MSHLISYRFLVYFNRSLAGQVLGTKNNLLKFTTLTLNIKNLNFIAKQSFQIPYLSSSSHDCINLVCHCTSSDCYEKSNKGSWLLKVQPSNFENFLNEHVQPDTMQTHKMALNVKYTVKLTMAITHYT